MNIENAKIENINEIAIIMKEIADIHISVRPDIFKEKTIENLLDDIKESINSNNNWIFVAKDNDIVKGILICKLKIIENHPNLKDSKVLWIDDLGVSSNFYKQGIGRLLVNKAIELAKSNNCSRVDLNCWKLNENAIKFYERIGITVQREIMELKIKNN